MITGQKCQSCGSSLDNTATRGGLCPVCLMRVGLATMSEVETMDQGHLALPHTFGPYELIEELGRGGMGVVYAARQSALDRTVAVKLLLSGAYASETALERFRKEAAAAAGLQHPNIVEIHDYGEWEGQPYYVMDLVPGRNLAQVCDGRPLGTARAAAILRELADAVHYAHQQGILHRDLKPSNVLLDDRDRARITDFGLARRLDDDSGVTQTGQMLGSPGYASPEQAAGRIAEVGVPSDVYGLGALFYHLLTGRAPFSAATPTETLRLVLETDPPPPRLLNPAVSRDLETICLKCLAKEPARRYASAADVGEDLERFLGNRPIRARPPSIVYRARKFARRYRTGVAAVAAVILALAIGLTLALAGYRRAVEQQHATDAARARSQEMVNFIMQKSLPQIQVLGRRSAMVDAAKTAVNYFEQLPPRLRDRDTIRAHATALDLLVQAYGNSFSRRTKADPGASRASAMQAATLWRKLAETDPSDADAIAAALFDEFLALIDDTSVSDIQRLAALDDLIGRFRILGKQFPGSEAIQVGLGRLLRYQVNNLASRAAASKSLPVSREAFRISERLLAMRPDDATLLAEFAWAWSSQSYAYAYAGDRENSVRCSEEGLAVAERLLARDPTNVQSLELAANLALRLLWSAPPEERKDAQIQVLRRYLSTLIALDPDDSEWHLMDAFALQQEAWASVIDGEFAEALNTMNRAVECLESIPKDSFDRVFLIQSIGLAGTFAAVSGDKAQAEADYKRLQGEMKTWADESGSVYLRSFRRFICLYFQSCIARDMQDSINVEYLSREMLFEAERHRPDFADQTLLPPVFRAGAQSMLGEALFKQGRIEEAVPVLEDALAWFHNSPTMAPFFHYIYPGPTRMEGELTRARQQLAER